MAMSAADAAVRVDDLVARACERAGLDDFGGDSWREGLQLLVARVNRHPVSMPADATSSTGSSSVPSGIGCGS